MGYSREKTPAEIGLQLSIRLRGLIEDIPSTISEVDCDDVNLDDIDKVVLTRELTILTYVGQRLALIMVEFAAKDKRKAICDALDSFAVEFLETSPEFDELLDRRGEQYFQLLNSHIAGVWESGDWSNYLEALAFHFEQFCRGRGGGENDPIVIGSFWSMIPLRWLASYYWTEGFIKTTEYVIGPTEETSSQSGPTEKP